MLRKKLKIRSRDRRYLLAFLLAALIIVSGVAYRILNPPKQEHFFAMWVVGADGTVGHYYPNDNRVLTASESMNWTIGVYNHMSGLEYVVVEVKLLNATMTAPNESTAMPSQASAIFELTRVLLDNETWSIPFNWEILSLAQRQHSLHLLELSINQTAVSGDLAEAVSGYNFRIVFELWSYDEASGNLVFSWPSTAASTPHSVWNEIWFNATA